jgi:hypothetical protein
MQLLKSLRKAVKLMCDMTSIVVEVEKGTIYGIKSDRPTQVVILDKDEERNFAWEADFDPDYVKKQIISVQGE